MALAVSNMAFFGLVLAVSSILAAVLINWLLGYWSAGKIALAGLLLSIFAALLFINNDTI